MVVVHKKKQKNDFVGALKRIPWKVLKLYVHAYQSKLWNEIAEKIAKKASPAHEDQLKNSKITIPLIGFATEVEDKDVEKIVKKIMQNEKIICNDFVIRQIPDLSSEGSERELYTEVKNLKIEKLEDDDLNKGKKKIKITFSFLFIESLNISIDFLDFE